MRVELLLQLLQALETFLPVVLCGVLALEGSRLVGAHPLDRTAIVRSHAKTIDVHPGSLQGRKGRMGRMGKQSRATRGEPVSKRTMKTLAALFAAAAIAVSASASAQRAGSGGTLLAFEAASIKLNRSGDLASRHGPRPRRTFHRDQRPCTRSDCLRVRRLPGQRQFPHRRRAEVDRRRSLRRQRQRHGHVDPAADARDDADAADRSIRPTARTETREMPTYALAVVPNQPLRLHRSVVDDAACQARRAAIQRREPVPPPVPGAPPICGSGRAIPGTISAVGGSTTALASTLGQFVSRSVVDRTQLAGLFDFELKWTPDTIPQVPADAPPLNIDPNGPSIFTALQEQLGLRLESTRGPVDVVVIDRVERPTSD